MKTIPLNQPPPPPPGPEAALAAIDRFRQLISNGSWFAAVGARLTAAELGEAASYLAALAVGRWTINPVADWAEAKALAKGASWDPSWQDAERELHERLFAQARRLIVGVALIDALDRVTEAASDAVNGAAALVSARSGAADPALLRVATTAATQACYQAALALATGGNADHPFSTKHRLFAAGRWPLGVIHGQFHVF
ncbi:MAG: hypothetical protein HYR63_15625 [Proteobacteria bacterium]|nr:hypothetical protein [Pseudomonadota bacterium]MBI3499723.1 hypothetical protein [Pseudomonadota bacterium]